MTNCEACAKALQTLGLAYRAKKVILGTDSVLRALRSGALALVIATRDTSRRTADQLNTKCYYYETPLLIMFDSKDTEHLFKKHVKVVGVTDENFAQLIANRNEVIQ